MDVKARSIGGTDRSRKALGFWMSSLENGNFKRLENRNVAKISKRENLVALARGFPQDLAGAARLVPPASPPSFSEQ